MAAITVALIEDDRETRAIFRHWLAEVDEIKVVAEFGSAEEAIAHLASVRPEVVFTDINLPGRSGIECVQRLKPLIPDTQFIMLTVYSDSKHLFDALAAGASGYLLKRTTREDLIEAVKDAQAGSSPMSGSIARQVVQYFHTGQPAEPEDTPLSARELAVLEQLANGYLYKEIAESLGISVLTVNTHVRHIYEKMHVRSRGQAVAKFINRNGRLPQWPRDKSK